MANLFRNSLLNFRGLTVIKPPPKSPAIVQEELKPIESINPEGHAESGSDGEYLEEEEDVVTSDCVQDDMDSNESDESDEVELNFEEKEEDDNVDLDSGVCGGTESVGMSEANVTSVRENEPIADTNDENEPIADTNDENEPVADTNDENEPIAETNDESDDSLPNQNEGQEESFAEKLPSDEGIGVGEFGDPVNEALCPFELNSSFEREHSFTTDPITGQVALKKFTSSELVEIDRIRVVNALDAIDPVMETTHDYRRRLHLKKFVLIDLSGTLHVENESTPGAIRALMLLRANGYKVLFVTNTTKESRAKLHQRLLNLGFVVEIEEIFTSMNATREYVMDNGLRPSLMVSQDALEDFDGVETSDPNCVVIGLSQNHFNHAALTAAHRLIMEKDGQIIAIHKGKKYLSSNGMKMGPGGFVTALEFSTNKSAIVLGKPSSAFYEAALKYVGCTDPSMAVMIGDDIRDDVYGAMLVGVLGILVKTGKFSPDDMDKIYPHKPDIVCKNFSEAVQLLIDEKQYLSPKGSK